MREIKFRKKSTGGAGWVHGFYAYDPGSEHHYYIYRKRPSPPNMNGGVRDKGVLSLNPFLPYTIDPKTVGQYTGLKDKNGVEIYEGDVVRCYFDGELVHRGRIQFGPDYPAFEITPWEDTDFNSLQYYASIEGEIEVIGNVHEHPELLEVGE